MCRLARHANSLDGFARICALFYQNFDHRKERAHDQGISHTVIELFEEMWGKWHGIVETTCRSNQCHPFEAERTVLSKSDIERY